MLLNHCRAFAITVIAVVLSGHAPVAYATQYIGIDGSSISLDSDNEDGINPLGARVRLGVEVSEWFDLEAHFGGGNDNSTRTFNSLSVAYAGLYLKGYLPIGKRSAVYALAGVAAVEITQTIARSRFTDQRNGFSYGIGAETQVSEYWDLTLDYVRYTLNDENFSEVSAVNFGLKWYF